MVFFCHGNSALPNEYLTQVWLHADVVSERNGINHSQGVIVASPRARLIRIRGGGSSGAR